MCVAFAIGRSVALACLLEMAGCQTPSSGTGAPLAFPDLEAMRLGSLTPGEAIAIYGVPRFQADGSGLEPADANGGPAHAGSATLTEDVPRAVHWAEVNPPPVKLAYNVKSMTFTYMVKAYTGRYTFTRARQLSMTFHNGYLSYYAYASRLPEPNAKRWNPQDVAILTRGASHLPDVINALGQPTAANLCRYWSPATYSYGQPTMSLEYYRAETQKDARNSKVAWLRFDGNGVLADYAVSSASAGQSGMVRMLDEAEEFGRLGTGLTCK